MIISNFTSPLRICDAIDILRDDDGKLVVVVLDSDKVEVYAREAEVSHASEQVSSIW